MENLLFILLFCNYLLLYTCINKLPTSNNTVYNRAFTDCTFHQAKEDLDKYLITVFLLKTVETTLCSPRTEADPGFLNLPSFLSQKPLYKKGVYPPEKRVVLRCLWVDVPPIMGRFTFLKPTLTHPSVHVQRKTFSMSAGACLRVFHNLFITIFHLFLPSFQKNRLYIYVYHSENKR